jgi:hypothetical protein
MTDDVTVYPADEEEQHDLYSAKCKCKPTVEVIGATLVYSHNRLWELIVPTRDKTSQVDMYTKRQN